ncbi:MAG: N-acetylornithine carbamoyltransferase [Sporocytophaga sp.]|nr:N-acetylornithine carbamoyltransferase [Sporocytophaga sp.]
MRNFTSVHDVDDVTALVNLALELKQDPLKYANIGRNKTLGLIFFNPSLRTRLSTQKAAHNLTLRVMDMNVGQDSWNLEIRDNVVMDGDTSEHIKEAAAVIGQYCDIIGIRSFPSLNDKDTDYKEEVIQKFITYSGVPVVSLESATRHPLQSLADLVTINELKKTARPKVVLTWAAHPKALPQAVPNSFAEWMNHPDANVDLVITHPEGYELDPKFTQGAKITYNQNEALEGADFVYAKNWSSYKYYGNIISKDKSWMISPEKMKLTNQAKFMHCLPVRRNVIVSDAVIDSPDSVVIQQAGNRVWSAQAVLKKIIEDNLS